MTSKKIIKTFISNFLFSLNSKEKINNKIKIKTLKNQDDQKI